MDYEGGRDCSMDTRGRIRNFCFIIITRFNEWIGDDGAAGIFEARNWIEMEEWINSEWEIDTRAFVGERRKKKYGKRGEIVALWYLEYYFFQICVDAVKFKSWPSNGQWLKKMKIELSWLSDTQATKNSKKETNIKLIITNQNCLVAILAPNDEWPSFATKLIQPNPLSIILSWIISQTWSRITSATYTVEPVQKARFNACLEFTNSSTRSN